MGDFNRNDPCPCGSGKKYKHCCLQRDEALAARKCAETAAIRKHLQAALAHYRAGRIPQAEALCREALRVDQNFPDALHLSGLIAQASGKSAMAAELINRAIQFKPSDPAYFNDLGPVYQSLNRLDDAIASYQQALALKPDHAEACNNMGNIFGSQRRFDEAVACYRKAIGIKPKFAEAHFNLGNVLKDCGKFDDAVASYQKAIAIKPDFAGAHSNLAVAFDSLGKTDAAIDSCRKAIRLDPNLAQAYNNLGGLLKDKRRLGEAIPCFRKALAIKPDFAEACNNLGDALKNQGQFQEAIVYCQKAISLNPYGLPGLDSAVRLATLYYLQDDLAQAARMIELAQPILGQSGPQFRAAQAYCQYIDKLLAWRNQTDPAAQSAEGTDILYVIGDSHILSAHNVLIRKAGKVFVCRGMWIEGCKQWHLGNEESNPYKDQFRTMMESAPRDATVLISVGEIDCRPDEGILIAWKKYPEKSVEEIVHVTVTGFLEYASRIAAARNQKIIISGVPATGLSLAQFTEEAAKQYTELLKSFNGTLRECSLKRGMDFLDVFALTDSGNGVSNGQWHLDAIHLRPDAITEAFARHYLSAVIE